MNAMLDPRAFIPFLYDPATLSMIQQQQQAAAAASAIAAAQSKAFSSLPTNSSTSSISNTSSSASSSFRIHDLLDASKVAEQQQQQNPSSSTPNNSAAAAAAAAALAQMMGAAFPSGPSLASSLRLNSSISDQANSSGENDSFLDDLDGNHSSRSSSAGTPLLHDRSSENHNNNNNNGMPDRSSNCSSSASNGGGCGGPMHSSGGKKARKARTIFTDKQLQELETTFDRQKYLSVQDRMDLAHRMGLSDTQVKTWYQNRRTKWKRQAAVGVDLLHEANNLAAVQNLIRTNPYWNQYITNHAFAQQRLCQAGIVPPNGTSPFSMLFQPGMIPSSSNGIPGFPSNGFPSNLPHDLIKSPNTPTKCDSIKDESVSPRNQNQQQESPNSETKNEKIKKEDE